MNLMIKSLLFPWSRVLAVLLVPLAASITACGSDSVDEAILATPPLAVQLEDDGDEYDSEYDGVSVPVPDGTRFVETGEVVEEGDYAANQGLEVPGWSFDELRGWYDEQMPADAPYAGFEPCDVTEGDALILSDSQGRQREVIDEIPEQEEGPNYTYFLDGQPYTYEYPDELTESDVISNFISEPVETRTWAKFDGPEGDVPFKYLDVEQLGVSLGGSTSAQMFIEDTDYTVGSREFEIKPNTLDSDPRTYESTDTEDPSLYVESKFNYLPDAVSPECASAAPELPEP